MRELNRRQFFASAALPGLLSTAGKLQAATPAMAIAHYKAPPSAPDGIAEEARRLTRRAVEALGGMRRFVSKGNVVWVKPNIGWDRRPEQAACTNPDVVAAIVEMCFQAGAKKVTVSDHPCNSPQRTFPRSGIQAAAEKAGADCYFMDDRKFRKMAIRGGKVIKEWEVYTEVVEADLVINVPIVKCHDLSKATLGMKNLLGVTAGPRDRFHQNIAGTAADLAGFIKPAPGGDGRSPDSDSERAGWRQPRRCKAQGHRGGKRGPGGHRRVRRYAARAQAVGYRLRGGGTLERSRKHELPVALAACAGGLSWRARSARLWWFGCAAACRACFCFCSCTCSLKRSTTPSIARATT